MPKDRGAEHGNVDGSLECGLALGMVAAETRGRMATTPVRKEQNETHRKRKSSTA